MATSPLDGSRARLPPMLRLRPLAASELPPHPDLATAQNDPPSLVVFLKSLLAETRIEEFESGFKSLGALTSMIRDVPVVVKKLERVESPEDGGLAWHARMSEHEEGSPVTYQELDNVVRKNHEQNEMVYTPNIYDANTLVHWELGDKVFGTIHDVEMRVTQMHHTMPFPLCDRFFSVLVVSFAKREVEGLLAESIDMQIPINWTTLPEKVQERSHVVRRGRKLMYRDEKKELVEGIYVSLEKLMKKDATEDQGSKPRTTWFMMTASNARGRLPLWVQRKGVPGAIAKDVPLAIEHIVRVRAQSSHD